MLLYGAVIIVLGVVFSSVGGACTHDHLLGFTNCNRNTAFWLTAFGIGCFTPGWIMFLGWYQIWRQRLRVEASKPKPGDDVLLKRWVAMKRASGVVLLVKGLILACVGGACMEDVLWGVSQCAGKWEEAPFFKDFGISLVITGSGMYIPGLFILLYYGIPAMSRTFSFASGYAVTVGGMILFGVGAACLADSLYGVAECHDGGVKLMMAAFVVIALGLLLFSWGHPKIKARYKAISCTVPVFIGAGLLVGGTAFTYYGWAGAENIIPARRVVFLSMGLSMQLVAVYFLCTAYFWKPLPQGDESGAEKSLLSLIPRNLIGSSGGESSKAKEAAEPEAEAEPGEPEPEEPEQQPEAEAETGAAGSVTQKKEKKPKDEASTGTKSSSWYLQPTMLLGVIFLCMGTGFVIRGADTINGARHIVVEEFLDEEGSSWEMDEDTQISGRRLEHGGPLVDGLTADDDVWYDQQSHDNGIVLTISGSFMIFIGILFIGTSASDQVLQVVVVFVVEVFLFGIVLVAVGKTCLSDNLVGVPQCEKHAAYIMIIVGGLALFMSLVPSVFCILSMKKRELVKNNWFKIGAVVFMVSSVGLVFGMACNDNLIMGVDQCDRFGRWSLAVKLIFWFGWALFLSMILMSSVVMRAEYARLRARMAELSHRKKPLFLLGFPLMPIGFLLTWIGGACVDGEMLRGCRDEGFDRISIGSSLFLFGLFMVYMACEWTWSDDPNQPDPDAPVPEPPRSSSAVKRKEMAAVMFSKYDKDGGGTIDGAEFKAMTAEMGQQLSTDEAKQFAAFLDKDGDGKISLKELTDYFDSIAPPEDRTSPEGDEKDVLSPALPGQVGADGEKKKPVIQKLPMVLPMLLLGAIILLIGIGNTVTGFECIGEVEGGDVWRLGTPLCPRAKGVAYAQSGGVSFFVGVLFIGCSFVRKSAVRAWSIVGLDCFFCGSGVLYLGVMCVMKKMGGSGICTPKLDGILIIVVGGILMGLPLIGMVYYNLYIRWPDIVGTKLWTLGCLVWVTGVVGTSFGIACWTNNMVGMRECDRFGRWSLAVKELFWGGWLFAIGFFLMSLVMFRPRYKRLWARMVELLRRKKVLFVIGSLLVLIGVPLGCVGGLCLDGTAGWFDDCREVGFERVSNGVSIFLFGFFMMYMACEWRWADDGEKPASAAAAEPAAEGDAESAEGGEGEPEAGSVSAVLAEPEPEAESGRTADADKATGDRDSNPDEKAALASGEGSSDESGGKLNAEIPMIVWGIFFTIYGWLTFSYGFECIGEVEGGDVWRLGTPLCPRAKGVAYAQSGGVSFFVGVLFIGCSFVRKSAVRAWSIVGLDCFFCGSGVLYLGVMCVMKKMGGSGICTPKLDGILIIVVGGILMGLPLIGFFWALLLRIWPEIVSRRLFALGALLWATGVVGGSFGIACATNNMVGVRNCPRTGRWSLAVKELFWGGWLFAIGLFLMSLVIFEARYKRLWARMKVLFELRKPLFIVGCSMMGAGILFGAFGASCIDGEMMSGCQDAGIWMLSLGPSMFLIGFFLFYITCDWVYPEDLPREEEDETRMSLLHAQAAAEHEPSAESSPGSPKLSLIPLDSLSTSSMPQSTSSKAESADGPKDSEAEVGVRASSRGMVGVGLVVCLFSVGFVWSGAACLNIETPEDLCSHRRGVILTVIGATGVFTSVLFIGCANVTNSITALCIASGDTIVSGLIVMFTGGMCMGNIVPMVPNCHKRDGEIMMITGAPMIIFSGGPTIWLFLIKKHPELVKKPLFLVGAALFVVGMTLVFVGFACAQNRLYQVDECDRRGPWNTAVKLMFWGALAFWLGLLFMSFVISNLAYVRLRKQMAFLIRTKHLGFLSGSLLLLIGFVLGVAGTACLDGTFVRDCREDGFSHLSSGVPLFLLGFFMVFTSCGWPHEEEGPEPTPGASDDPDSTPSSRSAPGLDEVSVKCPMAEFSPMTPVPNQLGQTPPPASPTASPTGRTQSSPGTPMTEASTPGTASDEKFVVTRRPGGVLERVDLYIGLLMIMVGLVCFATGYECISNTVGATLNTYGTPLCDRMKGMTYLKTGFASVLVGVLFAGCSLVPRELPMLAGVCALGMELSGGTMLYFGIMCVAKKMNGTGVCVPKEDGIPLTVGGGILVGLPLIAGAYGALFHIWPEIVGRKTFMVGSLSWFTGVVGGSFGIACATNNMVGVRNCPRTGRWSLAVKELFWGGWLFAIGLFLMSLAIFSSRYSRLWKRMKEVWRSPLFIFGWLLMAVGIVLGSFGGACVDDTLYGVNDCRAAGAWLLSVGPPMFLVGFFMFYMACDWNWTMAGAEQRRQALITEELERMALAAVPAMEFLASEIEEAKIGGARQLLAWENLQTLDEHFTEDQQVFLEELAKTTLGTAGSAEEMKVKLDGLLAKKVQQDAENALFESKGGNAHLRHLEKTVSHTKSASNDLTSEPEPEEVSAGRSFSLSLVPLGPTSSEPGDLLAVDLNNGEEGEGGEGGEVSGPPVDGMLNVTVVGCTGLLPADHNGKSDPYVLLGVGQGGCTKKPKRTHAKESTLNPDFGELFHFSVSTDGVAADYKLALEVYDHDLIGHDDFLGHLELDLGSVFEDWNVSEEVERSFDLDDGGGKVPAKLLRAGNADSPCGSVQLKLQFIDAAKLRPPSDGVVSVTVISCARLLAADSNGKSDPYVLLGLGRAGAKAPKRTKTKHATLAPQYHEHFDFSVVSNGPAVDYHLAVEVRDADAVGHDDVLGLVGLDLGSAFGECDWRAFHGESAIERQYDLDDGGGVVLLKPSKGKHPYGSVKLRLEFTDSATLTPKVSGCGCGYIGFRQASLYIGLVLMLVSIPVISYGAGHLRRSMDGVWYTSRRAGLIMITNGSTGLFLGFLYFSISFVRRGVLVWLLTSLDLLCFGIVLAWLGASCTDGISESCTEGEGYSMVLIGGALIFLSIYPPVCGFFAKFFGDIVKQPFFVSGFTLLSLGVIVTSFSWACYDNNILGINDCDRRGKWSVAVHLLFWGLFSCSFGILGMLIARFEPFFEKRWGRFMEVKRQPSLILGCLFLAVGSVLVGVGGACVDDTLVGVANCQSAGTVLLSIGLPAIFFGFFLMVFAYVWAWGKPAVVGIGGDTSSAVKVDSSPPRSPHETSSARESDFDSVFVAAPPARLDDSGSLPLPPPRGPPRPQPVWDPIHSRATLYYGLVLVLCGLVTVPIGSVCLNVDMLVGELPCPHQRGVILTVVGANALFVGALFLGLTFSRDAMVMAYMLAGDLFVFSVVISVSGWLCLGGALPGVDSCKEVDGVILSFVGAGLLFLATIPVLWLQLRRRYPHIAKQEQFTGGVLSLIVGIFVFSLGWACADNRIYGLSECDRTGKWNDAVTMLVLGGAAVLLGLLIGSTAFYPESAGRFFALCFDAPVFGLGVALSFLGLVVGAVGGSCLDNTLPGIDKCPHAAGMFLLVGGILSIGTGVLAAHTAWHRLKVSAGAFLVRTHINATYLLATGVLLGSAGGLCLADAFPASGTGCVAVGQYLFPIGWYVAAVAGLLALVNGWYSRPVTFIVTPQVKALLHGYVRSGEPVFVLAIVGGLVTFCVGVACLTGTLAGQPECSEGAGAVATSVGAVMFIMAGTFWGMRYFHRRCAPSRPVGCPLTAPPSHRQATAHSLSLVALQVAPSGRRGGRRRERCGVGALGCEWPCDAEGRDRSLGRAPRRIGESGLAAGAVALLLAPSARTTSAVDGTAVLSQLRLLQRGERVGGSLKGDSWLQVEYPSGSGAMGWVLARKSSALVFMELVPGAEPPRPALTTAEKARHRTELAAAAVQAMERLEVAAAATAELVAEQSELVDQIGALEGAAAAHGGLESEAGWERHHLESEVGSLRAELARHTGAVAAVRSNEPMLAMKAEEESDAKAALTGKVGRLRATANAQRRMCELLQAEAAHQKADNAALFGKLAAAKGWQQPADRAGEADPAGCWEQLQALQREQAEISAAVEVLTELNGVGPDPAMGRRTALEETMRLEEQNDRLHQQLAKARAIGAERAAAVAAARAAGPPGHADRAAAVARAAEATAAAAAAQMDEVQRQLGLLDQLQLSDLPTLQPLSSSSSHPVLAPRDYRASPRDYPTGAGSKASMAAVVDEAEDLGYGGYGGGASQCQCHAMLPSTVVGERCQDVLQHGHVLGGAAAGYWPDDSEDPDQIGGGWPLPAKQDKPSIDTGFYASKSWDDDGQQWPPPDPAADMGFVDSWTREPEPAANRAAAANRASLSATTTNLDQVLNSVDLSTFSQSPPGGAGDMDTGFYSGQHPGGYGLPPLSSPRVDHGVGGALNPLLPRTLEHRSPLRRPAHNGGGGGGNFIA